MAWRTQPRIFFFGKRTPDIWARLASHLRTHAHVKTERQDVMIACRNAAVELLAVRRDAAARRQGLAAGGAGAAKVLDWTLSSLFRAEDPHLVPLIPSGPPGSVGPHLKRRHGDHRADFPALAAVAALDARAVAALDAFIKLEALRLSSVLLLFSGKCCGRLGWRCHLGGGGDCRLIYQTHGATGDTRMDADSRDVDVDATI